MICKKFVDMKRRGLADYFCFVICLNSDFYFSGIRFLKFFPEIGYTCTITHSFIYLGNEHTQKKQLTNKQDKINKQTHE